MTQSYTDPAHSFYEALVALAYGDLRRRELPEHLVMQFLEKRALVPVAVTLSVLPWALDEGNNATVGARWAHVLRYAKAQGTA
jgi:hypothetical protein